MIEFALVTIMIAFLYELRFFISEDHAKPIGFFALSCVAMIVSFSAGVSEMVGFFAGKLSKGSFCIEAFFCLSLSLYVLARVISYIKSLDTDNKENVSEQ
jgi:hypothetical protein